MIEEQEVFEAVRRGYGDLSNATDGEVVDYFTDIDDEAWTGHM
jgi:predicted phosphoribosyltransferase